jgi:hypothetical protein
MQLISKCLLHAQSDERIYLYEEPVALRDSQNEGQQGGRLYLQQPNFLAKGLN